MTQKETLAAIRALGLTARVRDGEYRVNFKDGAEATAYYTTDAEDALDTARAMKGSSVQPKRRYEVKLSAFAADDNLRTLTVGVQAGSLADAIAEARRVAAPSAKAQGLREMLVFSVDGTPTIDPTINAAATVCTYPRCKCIVSTSTSEPEPVCPLGLPQA